MSPPKLESVNQEELERALDRLLAERLRDTPATASSIVLGALRTAIRGIRKGPKAPRQKDIIARIRSLPADVQETLRRHYIFLEAEESICASMKVTPAEYRRLRRDACDYILMRRETKPEFDVRQRFRRDKA